MSIKSNLKRQKQKQLFRKRRNLSALNNKPLEVVTDQPLPEFIDRLKKEDPNFNLNTQTPDVKPSNIIIEFAKPITAKCKTEGDWKDAIKLATMAWNRAVSDSDDPLTLLSSYIDVDAATFDDDSNPMAEMMALIKRKKSQFAQHNFIVKDYMVKAIQGQVHVSVAVTQNQN